MIIVSFAHSVIGAALNNAPRLKYALGNFTETLIVTGEKLANTGLDAAKKFANTELVKQTVVIAKKGANTGLGKKAINAGKEVSKQVKRAQ